jgi:hypothetical protein
MLPIYTSAIITYSTRNTMIGQWDNIAAASFLIVPIGGTITTVFTVIFLKSATSSITRINPAAP